MISEAFPEVLIDAHGVSVVVGLEDFVVIEDPVVLRRDVGSKKAAG